MEKRNLLALPFAGFSYEETMEHTNGIATKEEVDAVFRFMEERRKPMPDPTEVQNWMNWWLQNHEMDRLHLAVDFFMKFGVTLLQCMS